ncbi:MAG: sigma-70 family RNA polymerase sigma factor [Bacteroidota bacterium]|nr:sigma-70 family RNA polymerase sigma factor [Bacteroidota bacterium]
MWLFKKKEFASDEAIAHEYYLTGNKTLVGDLFEKHVKTVFGVCLFYFKDKDVAKDMVMQIFEKLLTELKKSEVKNFKAWLSFVVRNYCISELRKNKHKHFVSENYLDFEVNTTTLLEEEKIESVNEELLLEYMKECLPQLKENQKLCVELFYLQNLSYQQIADKTKFSLNEIKSYIQNGKRNLKLLIEQKQNIKKHAA